VRSQRVFPSFLTSFLPSKGLAMLRFAEAVSGRGRQGLSWQLVRGLQAAPGARAGPLRLCEAEDGLMLLSWRLAPSKLAIV
jgi:hypothetical protein